MAQEENFKTNMKNIITSLHKIVECPVCLDTIKVPFKTCSRGHGVCNSCCTKLEKCPTCQGPFTAENPICLKNLLEALPRLCCYSADGCEEIVEQGSDHEEFCGCRPIACRHLSCKEKMPLCNLMDHYKKDHPERYICKTNNTPMDWPKFDPQIERKDQLPVILFNNIFWLSVYNNVEEKHLELSFQATPVGKLKNNYFARVKFEKGEFLYASTIKASLSSSCEIEEEVEGEGNDSDIEEKYSMEIPQSALHKFISAEGKLQYDISIFEEEK